MSGENSGSFPEWDIKLFEIVGSILSTKVRIRSTLEFFSDSKSCLSGLNWPGSGKKH